MRHARGDAQPINSRSRQTAATACAMARFTATPDAMKIPLALSVIALLSLPALADEPLPAPQKQTVCSPSRKVCASSDPQTRVTVVSPRTSRQQAWTIPGWHRWLFVSDDGESVVIGPDGINLLAADVTLAEPVLWFYNRGRLVRTVTLGDLYQRKSQLRRTVSHWAWVNELGINRANQLVAELTDGTTIAFALSTGKVQPRVTDAPR